MKRLLVILCTLLPVAAGAENFYVAGFYGQTNASYPQSKADALVRAKYPTIPGASSTSSNADIYKLLAGYQFANHFAIEAAGVDLGSVTYSANSAAGSAHDEIKLRAASISLVASTNMEGESRDIRVFAKLGFAQVNGTSKGIQVIAAIPQPSPGYAWNGRRRGAIVGGGFIFPVDQNWIARLDLDYYKTGIGDIFASSLGIGYRF